MRVGTFWQHAIVIAAVTLTACGSEPDQVEVPSGSVGSAATLTVTSTADAGTGSLREAIALANAGDTIAFDPLLSDAAITLVTTGDTAIGASAILIDKDLTIDGSGAPGVRLVPTSQRVFRVASGATLALVNVTLSGGVAQGANGQNRTAGAGGGGAGMGGAIFVDGGGLVATGCTFSSNAANGGNGGVDANTPGSGGTGGGPFGGSGSGFNSGVTGGTGGFASGGGGGGNANSDISAGANGGAGGLGGFGGGGGGGGGQFGQNMPVGGVGAAGSGGFGGGSGAAGIVQFPGMPGGAGGGGAGMGGAIFSHAGSVTLTNCTLTSNTATRGTGVVNGSGLGGAVFNRNGSLTVLNSTIYDNSAPQGGDGIYNLGDAAAATVVLQNAIVYSAGSAAVDFVGSTISGGVNSASGAGNIIGTLSGFGGTVVSAADPVLSALGAFGGPTQTHFPQPGSPAIDAATVACPALDQRGATREAPPDCDIGAVEAVSEVTLSADVATVDEATGVATITATLDLPAAVDVTVTLSFAGTATSVTDYTVSSPTILITSGNLTGTTTVTAVQDNIDEPDETIAIAIDSVTNAVEAGTQETTVTILDDDPTPMVALTVDAATILEASATATITATLSGASSVDVTVTLGTSGTAVGSGVDYVLASSSIVVPAGSLTGTTAVTSVQDTLDELDETVVIDITGVTNATENATQQVTTTITDDDPPPSVTLAVDPSSIAEAGGVATLTATLSAVSSFEVTANLLLGGTALGSGTDYLVSGTASIVVAAGSLTGTATVTAVQDALDETDETVTVDIDSVDNGTEDGSQQVTIVIEDDDVGPGLTLSSDVAIITSAGGMATITATVSEVSALDVTVDLGFSGTSSADDYTASASAIVIAPGDLTGTATITVAELPRKTKTVIVDVSSVANGSEVGAQQVTITIEGKGSVGGGGGCSCNVSTSASPGWGWALILLPMAVYRRRRASIPYCR